MVLLSWLTADTKESIRVGYLVSKKDKKPVYLIQPNGEPPIEENDYDGYGGFGDVDALSWLAEKNIGTYSSKIGSKIHLGEYFTADNVSFYLCAWHHSKESISFFSKYLPEDATFTPFDTFGNLLKVNGIESDVNEHVSSGRLKRVKISEIIGVKYPLKFSHNPNAIYEELPASEDCPMRGGLG